MNEHTAVNKMMMSIKIEESIPEQYYSFLRTYLQQMYVVGYDQGRQEIYDYSERMIGQYNREKRLINVFRSEKEAAKFTGFTDRGIRKALHRDSPTKQGWYWRWINKKEGVLTNTL